MEFIYSGRVVSGDMYIKNYNILSLLLSVFAALLMFSRTERGNMYKYGYAIICFFVVYYILMSIFDWLNPI